MLALIVWTLFCYGLTLVVTSSKLTLGFRDWVADRSAFLGFGLNCPMCVGFWSGALAYILGLRIAAAPHFTIYRLDLQHVIGTIVSGFASSALCWIAHVVLARLGAEDL